MNHKGNRVTRWYTIFICILELLLSIYAFCFHFQSNDPLIQLVEDYKWIDFFDFHWRLGIGGLSIGSILLTGFITLAALAVIIVVYLLLAMWGGKKRLYLNNELNFLFVTLYVVLLFAGAIAKSAQFPLHVWLPDTMDGPIPISTLIHAATMVASGIFLVARLLPLFGVIPYIMYLISVIGTITVLLGDILVSIGLYDLITHAYSKTLLFLESGSIIHSMVTIVGYSPSKSQNMGLMGCIRKHVPITKITFLLCTLSLCGIPPLACFWSKDEILNDSWLYSQIFTIIAWDTTVSNYGGKQKIPFYSISLWGKNRFKKNSCLLTMN
uniref:NADH:quinone oxidoreductase/Mrp antiporter transmembrane domain-containing protein n=1 Tax=Solanum lycopersicum TaxID=4081 RepID=A0A3Q7JMC0_SOLLC